MLKDIFIKIILVMIIPKFIRDVLHLSLSFIQFVRLFNFHCANAENKDEFPLRRRFVNRYLPVERLRFTTQFIFIRKTSRP